MSKICGYSCEHNKSGVCQISVCDKKLIISDKTEVQTLTRYIDPTIEELQQENQKYKEVIFKIKMIISARIKEYQKKIDNEIDMGSRGDHFKICRYEENIKFLKDILKEVK